MNSINPNLTPYFYETIIYEKIIFKSYRETILSILKEEYKLSEEICEKVLDILNDSITYNYDSGIVKFNFNIPEKNKLCIISMGEIKNINLIITNAIKTILENIFPESLKTKKR